MCKCAKGQPIVIPYIRVKSKGGGRHFYLACSSCDSTDFWPNLNASSTKIAT